MLQGCKLLKWCWNLPAVHCVAVVQAVKVVLEPTCRALCCRGAGCLSGARTNLPGTVLQGCRLFKWCWDQPALHCMQGCRLFKQCQNLPAGCWTQYCRRGAGCLRGVGIHLLGTVLQGCRLFKQCQSLPAEQSIAGVQAV